MSKESEIEKENERAYNLKVLKVTSNAAFVSKLPTILVVLIITVGVVLVFWFAAGKNTTIYTSTFVKFVTDEPIWKSIYFLILFLLSFWGQHQKREKEKLIKRFAPLMNEKELLLDPNKQSSQITISGHTKKGD